MSDRMQALVSYRGRVQGVGFRATTERIARGFTLVGWVRNEADGSVSLLAEGDRGEIERFLSAVRERMAGFIRSEDRHEGPAGGLFTTFEVRR